MKRAPALMGPMKGNVMSAFVVKDDTINEIVGYFLRYADAGNTMLTRPLAIVGLAVPTAPPAKRDKACWDLGKELHALNVRAVRARYADADECGRVSGEYTYEHDAGSPGNDVQVYKHIRCWRYQCMEGNVPKDPVFKAMGEVASLLAQAIVHNLPEYDSANWD